MSIAPSSHFIQMHSSARRVPLAIFLAALVTTGAAAADAPAPAPSPDACNNATHHADPLVAYFLTGKDLKVKKIKEEPRGVLAELIVATDNLAPGMPYIIHDGDVIKHGMLDTARFLADLEELHNHASKQGRHAHPGLSAAAQCFANFTGSALEFARQSGADNATMDAPTNAILFTAQHPDKGAVLDILGARLEGDTVLLSVLLVHEPEMVPEGACHHRQAAGNAFHYHFTAACSATKMAVEYLLPTAGTRGAMTVPGAFSIQIKLLPLFLIVLPIVCSQVKC